MILATVLDTMAVLAQASPEPVPPAVPAPVSGSVDIARVLAPILGTGVVGALFLMILFRIRVMPTYVYDEAKESWERQLAQREADVAELKLLVRQSTEMYTNQVIPVMTRSIDMNREYLEILRDRERGRGGGGSQWSSGFPARDGSPAQDYGQLPVPPATPTQATTPQLPNLDPYQDPR